jgi:Icc-related predicted phosphoesterase
MKIVAISDTHNKHRVINIPKCDILIHAGDATSTGDKHQIEHFFKWYAEQDAKYILFTPGNHDWMFQTHPEEARRLCDKYDVILLQDSGIELEGIKFWGMPWTPFFCNWAFNAYRGNDITKYVNLIPENTEVLITHGPRMGILDEVPRDNEKVGCYDLGRRIDQLLSLKLHVCGHIHHSSGEHYFNGVKYINAAMCDEMYMVTNQIKEIEL